MEYGIGKAEHKEAWGRSSRMSYLHTHPHDPTSLYLVDKKNKIKKVIIDRPIIVQLTPRPGIIRSGHACNSTCLKRREPTYRGQGTPILAATSHNAHLSKLSLVETWLSLRCATRSNFFRMKKEKERKTKEKSPAIYYWPIIGVR